VIEGGRTVDIGELHTTSQVVREVRITNAGTDTLRISDVSGSCGCTGTLLSDNDIPPGGGAVLKITFDPSRFRGKVEKAVSMNTNDPVDSHPRLLLAANIVPVLDVDTGHLTFSTLVDSEMTVEVAMRNASDRTFRITGVSSSSGQLAVRMSRDLVEPNGETQLLCALRQTEAGILRGTITITTDHPLLPSLDLPFFSYARKDPGQRPGSSSK
jgi:hypothetical protein